MSLKAVATKYSPHLLEIKCVMFKKLLLSFLAIIGLTFLISSNTFADSDVTVNVDFSSNRTELCATECSNLPYFKISFSSDYSGWPYLGYYDSSNNWTVIYIAKNVGHLYDDFILKFPTGGHGFVLFKDEYHSGSAVVTFSSSIGGGGITPSGTLNITENGTYDVTNYASAVVNVDQTISDLPPYSELVVDSFWKYHVAIAGGLASIFAIFVVYRIIKSRLR